MRMNMIRILAAISTLMMSVQIANAQSDDTTAVTTITLDGTSISVDGEGATVAGSRVTVTKGGTYRVKGTLTDGQVAVDTEDEATVTLLLDGVNISSSTSAAINIANAHDTAIVLNEGTENILSDATTYVYATPDDDEPNAALFSDDDLTISGSGKLTVKGNFNDGIASKDALTITDATITVQAVDDGIRGKNSLTINQAKVDVTTGGDGLKADNDEDSTLGYISIANGTFAIKAGGDAIQAETNLSIEAGTFTITSGGGNTVALSDDLSAKGLKAGNDIRINSGTFTIDSADDTLNSNNSLTINGGTFTLATGDDAIHSDATLTISGGSVNITTSNEGIESAAVTINGGEIHLVSSDDGVNAASDATSGNTIAIHGGYLVVNASGDGLDANGSIEMTGGTVIVHGPTMNNNGSLDFDASFKITGGLLVAAGSAGMAQVPGLESSQNALLINFDTTQQAGSLIHIQNSDGKDILTFAPLKGYQSIAFSSPDLLSGASYEVYIGGSTDAIAVDGLYQAGNYTGGQLNTNFTVEGNVTQIGRRGRFR